MFIKTFKKTALLSCIGMGMLVGHAQNNDLPEKGQLYEVSPLPSKQLYNAKVVYEAQQADLKNFTLEGWRYDRRNNCLSTGQYLSNVNLRATSNSFKVPALEAGEQLYLKISEAYSLESDYDYGKVLISSDNGSTWKSVHGVSGQSDLASSQVNISSFSGKTVKVAFQLTSDGSFESSGWDVFSISFEIGQLYPTKNYNPMARTTGVQELKITSVNSDNFPESVFVNFTLTDDSVNVTDLTISDLKLTAKYNENIESPGCQPKLFLADSTAKTPVDIVFVMDYSGSMSDDKDEVIDNISTFVNNLSATSDPRFGLVRYGYSSGSIMELKTSVYKFDTVSLTPDTAAFKTLLEDGLSGGIEWGYTALELALSADFRPNAKKIMILLTDEDATTVYGNHNQSISRDDVITKLQQDGITVYANVPNNSTNVNYDLTYGYVAAQTGGSRYDLHTPFDELSAAIENDVTATYTLKYCPSKINLDTLEHCLFIELAADAAVGDEDCYIASPDLEYITRDSATVAKEQNAIPEYSSLTLCFDVYDNNGPAPVTGTLYARVLDTTNTTSFLSYPLALTTIDSVNTKWCGTVDPSIVLDPAVEYYAIVNYADGHTLKSPSIDERFLSWTQAVLPNEAPEITPTHLPNGPQCSDFTLSFKVTDYTNGFVRVDLYHQEKNSPQAYTPINKYNGTLIDSMNYSITVPLAGLGTEYYIVAEDNFGTIGTYGEFSTPYLIEAVDAIFTSTTKSMHLDFTGMEIGCDYAENGDSVRVYYENTCGDLILAGQEVFSSSNFEVEVFGNDVISGAPNSVENGNNVVIEYVHNGTTYPLSQEEYNDNITITYSGRQIADKINFILKGNNIPIIDGDKTPMISDGTDFGTQTHAVTHGFKLSNLSCTNHLIKKVTGDIALSPNFTYTLNAAEDSIYITYLANSNETVQVDIITDNNQFYTFTVKGEIVPCADPEIYYEATLVPDGDLTPSSGEGTDFGSIATAISRDFDLVQVGVCNPEVTITSVSSDNASFIATEIDDATLNVEYLADSLANGTITVNLSNSTSYTFDVSGDVVSNNCAMLLVTPNPIPSGGFGVVSIQLDVDTSSVVFTSLTGPDGSTWGPTARTDALYYEVMAPGLAPGHYTLGLTILSPEPGCPYTQSISFVKE